MAGYKGLSVNWAKYAISANKFQHQVRSTKAVNLEQRLKEGSKVGTAMRGLSRQLLSTSTSSNGLDESKLLLLE